MREKNQGLIRPLAVTIAVNAIWIDIAVTIISIVLNWSNNELWHSTLDLQITPYVKYTILIAPIMQMYINLEISVGRNWARITNLLLVLFSSYLMFKSYMAGYIMLQPRPLIFKGIFSFSVAWISMILLFTPSANQWFNSQPRRPEYSSLGARLFRFLSIIVVGAFLSIFTYILVFFIALWEHGHNRTYVSEDVLVLLPFFVAFVSLYKAVKALYK